MVSSPPPAPDGDVHVTLRPLASSLPLGFLALAGGTFLLSGLQLGWIPAGESHQVALAILVFVVPLQLVATVFGYLARDVVTGTGMGILAGTWGAIGLVTLTAPPDTASDALGTMLVGSAVLLTVPAAAAAAAKLVPAAVIGTTVLRFAATGVQQLTGSGAWKDVAGVEGLVLAALAVYAGMALALEDAWPVAPLPVLRRGSGRIPESDGPAREPGVRRQL